MHADLAAKRLDEVVGGVVVDYDGEEDVRGGERASEDGIAVIWERVRGRRQG